MTILEIFVLGIAALAIWIGVSIIVWAWFVSANRQLRKMKRRRRSQLRRERRDNKGKVKAYMTSQAVHKHSRWSYW